MPADNKTLIEKIEALPAERIAEIEDFVDFIRLREQERALTRAAAAASAPAFRGHLEQSRRRHLRCPLSSAMSSWCPFPFTSQRASKKRPAVVVSNRAYCTTRPDLIVMAVTSQLRPDPLRRLGALDDDDLAALRKAISEMIG